MCYKMARGIWNLGLGKPAFCNEINFRDRPKSPGSVIGRKPFILSRSHARYFCNIHTPRKCTRVSILGVDNFEPYAGLWHHEGGGGGGGPLQLWPPPRSPAVRSDDGSAGEHGLPHRKASTPQTSPISRI